MSQITIFYIRIFHILACLLFAPVLIINSRLHKKHIRMQPFRDSPLVELYNKNLWIYQLYNFVMNFPLGNKIYAVLSPLEGKVLQVGSGTGALNKYLSEHNTRTFDLLNLEINKESIDYAVKKGIYTNYIHADICQRTPLADNTFDSIVFARCFHHIRNPYKALAECSRILKPKGHIIIADMASLSRDFPKNSFMMNSNFDGLIWRYSVTSFEKHIRKYLPSTLKIKEYKTQRQACVTNYNLFYPHTDIVILLEKNN